MSRNRNSRPPQSGCSANAIVIFIFVCILIAFCGRKKDKEETSSYGGASTQRVEEKTRTAQDDSVISWSNRARDLHYSSKTKEAIKLIDSALKKIKHSDTLLLQRASYYVDIGQKKKAKQDFDNVRYVSSPDYSRLKEVIYPESKKKTDEVASKPARKKVVGHCTLCNDGSYSPTCATGRGACSHHGGVRQYNAPIYE